MGIIGDYRVALRNSPSYEGDRDSETYPMYNTKMYDSLENTAKYAEECASLPLKDHFIYDLKRYYATIKACGLMKELALALDPLEAKRKYLLSQCPNLSKENCPDYYIVHEEEIDGLVAEYMNKYDELLERFL